METFLLFVVPAVISGWAAVSAARTLWVQKHCCANDLQCSNSRGFKKMIRSFLGGNFGSDIVIYAISMSQVAESVNPSLPNVPHTIGDINKDERREGGTKNSPLQDLETKVWDPPTLGLLG